MALSITPHLNFRGTAREALSFYATVLGGQLVALTSYAAVGMPADAPGADLVLFGLVVTADGARLMAYDVPGEPSPTPALASPSTRREQGMTITEESSFVSLGAATLDELTAVWDQLADGAHVIEPLAASTWSPGFGMLTDRFGVTWAISVDAAAAA